MYCSFCFPLNLSFTVSWWETFCTLKAHVSRALRTRLWRWDSIVAPDVRLLAAAHGDGVFWVSKENKNAALSSCRQSPWQLALPWTWLIYIATREKKIEKMVSLENTKQAFNDSPDVSLFSPLMPALRTLIETRTQQWTPAPRCSLSLPIAVAHAQIQTPTHLETQFRHLQQPWVSSQQDGADA